MAQLEEAVRAAGAEAMRFFRKDPRSWMKDAHSPVSEADLAADAVLKRHLSAMRPDYGWLSEESPHTPAPAGGSAIWIVDPIDGTRAFLKGKPEWTVSAALVEHGRPVVAAVFNPPDNLFYCAEAGHGAYLNGRRIHATRRPDIKGARVLAHDSALTGRRWRKAWPRMDLCGVNSIAYRLCLVAAGDYDATLSSSPKSDWDLAAADLILQESGAVVTGFNGAAFVYNKATFRHPNVVGAGMLLHARLIGHIAEAWEG